MRQIGILNECKQPARDDIGLARTCRSAKVLRNVPINQGIKQSGLPRVRTEAPQLMEPSGEEIDACVRVVGGAHFVWESVLLWRSEERRVGKECRSMWGG